ncbi:MAG: thioredoxin domain-containing protein, partial [Actinomycetota bacterium]
MASESPSRPPNRLAAERSPYLRAHADDPVEWYPWGDEAFDAAKAADRPVLVSVGFAASHPCERMHREVFRDEATAAYLNDHVVCILVDREERPEVDAVYGRVVSELSGGREWPLTVFATPDGLPIRAGTTFPVQDAAGTPSLAAVAREVAEAWAGDRTRIEEEALALVDRLDDAGRLAAAAGPLPEDALARAASKTALTHDEEHGGWGTASKYPQPQLLDLLVRIGARGLVRARIMAERTLRAMALGAVYDQVGGGFHRFASDRAWRTPSFEKMLPDNALLARVYTHAWQAWRAPLHRRIAEETLAYMVRDLATARGALAAGESAESEGVEGRFYTWTHDEVSDADADAPFFFGVNREGRSVLTALNEDPPAEALRRLREARAARRRPARDDTVLASWNGLAIGALAEGGATFSRPDLTEAARRAAEAVTGELLADGDLLHTAGIPGLLEDYAYLAEGLLTLWEVTFERRWLDTAAALADRMTALFWDGNAGAFRATPPGRADLLVRALPILDTATPSPNAVAAQVLLRLVALLGREDHRERAERMLRAAGPLLQATPASAAGLAPAVDLSVLGPKVVVLVGDPADAATRALAAEAWARLVPNRVLTAG